MPSILLAFADVGLAMPLQDSLETVGFSVTWDGSLAAGPSGPSRADLVIIESNAALPNVVPLWRALDPVPALLAIGGSGEAQHIAAASKVHFVSSSADAPTLAAAVQRALAMRFATGLGLAYARGALGLDELGSQEDQKISIVRAARTANLKLVQEALRWHAQDYVTYTEGVALLREKRALQIPEVELVKRLDGSKTVQTLVSSPAPLNAGHAACLIWAMASVDCAVLTKGPPNAATRERRAVAEARRHLAARRDRLEGSTFYDVLEVPVNAEIDDIQNAGELLARRFSPQALAEVDCGELAPLIEPLWDQVLKAQSTLLDWSARGRYNDWLAQNANRLQSVWTKGPHDGDTSEEHFANGQAALVEGDTLAAFSSFAAAARAWPDHPDYEVSLCWARFRAEIQRGKDRTTLVKKERQAAEDALVGRRPWPRALVALALLCAADGDPDAAKWHLAEALSINPGLAAARSLLTRLGG